MSFIPNAYAAGASATNHSGFDFISFLPMVIIFALFWLLLIRPQQKKAKEHQNMISLLQKGDEIMTSGGIIGKITKVEEQYISLEIAYNVDIIIQKTAIASKVEKGTLTKMLQK